VVTNQQRKEARPTIKKVAAILTYTSDEGSPPQIKESTRLAHPARQMRNMRKVIFSIIVVITRRAAT